VSEKEIGPEVKKIQVPDRKCLKCEEEEKKKYKILGIQKKSKLIFVKERYWRKIAFWKKNV
jgi:hypothetical protein